MAEETFQPIPTCLVPPPILEPEGAVTGEVEGEALPRVLRQAAGSDLHGGRILILAGVFLLLALVQAAAFLAFPRAGSLVVYDDAPRVRLVEERP